MSRNPDLTYQPVVLPLQDLEIECYSVFSIGCFVILLSNSNEYMQPIWWVPLAGLSGSDNYSAWSRSTDQNLLVAHMHTFYFLVARSATLYSMLYLSIRVTLFAVVFVRVICLSWVYRWMLLMTKLWPDCLSIQLTYRTEIFNQVTSAT